MTAGPTAPTQNRAQNYSHVAFNGFNSTPTYEQHDFHPQNAYQRANYEQTRIAKFGENNFFSSAATATSAAATIGQFNWSR